MNLARGEVAGFDDGTEGLPPRESSEHITRVLLVDDDEDEFLITRDLLREAEASSRAHTRHYELDWESHYEAGRDAMVRNAHDVYLVDYRLGARNGLNLLQEAVASGCRRPIILMTGQGDPGVDAEAARSGAADYLIKDQLDGLTLERTIRYAIAQKEAEERLRSSLDELLRMQESLDAAQRLTHLGSWTVELIHPKDGCANPNQWSNEVYRILGWEPGDVKPSREAYLSRVHPADRERAASALDRALNHEGAYDEEVRILLPSGQERVVHVHGQIEYQSSGEGPLRVVGTILDVTQRVAFEAALRASEERYALAAQGANDGLWDWDLLSGKIYYSPRWEAMAGLPAGTLRQDPHEWYSLVHPEDLDRLRSSLALHLAGDTPHFECEYRLRHAIAGYRWMLGRGLAVREANHRAYRIVGSQTNINAHKEALEQLAHNALFDGLTGLPNRALFLDRLDRSISRGLRRTGNAFAVLFLDIDRFKKINDSLGHSPGDAVLIEAAKRFETCLRPGDTVARLGGDEFAILLDDLSDQGQAMRVTERIQSELSRPFKLDGQEVFVTVSIGIALSRGGEERPEELLRNADTAMYRAKSQGRSRYEIFEVGMHHRAVHLLELETDLWRALERCEFRLYYQPIVDLETGEVAGFEALVRWQHPDKGLIPPGDFIALAEETGLIVPIGWWVLGEACRQTCAWQEVWPELPRPFVAVNLSSRQFSQPDLADVIRGSILGNGLDPSCVKLEITESLLMANTDSAAEALVQLKEIGVQLALDDFGTGYSSLSYLHRFPLDTLKIDRTFISGGQSRDKNVEIVNTILSLARGLSMSVVAEGVETAEQLEHLRALQCGYAQGFYFSKPRPPGEIEEFMAKNPRW